MDYYSFLVIPVYKKSVIGEDSMAPFPFLDSPPMNIISVCRLWMYIKSVPFAPICAGWIAAEGRRESAGKVTRPRELGLGFIEVKSPHWWEKKALE